MEDAVFTFCSCTEFQVKISNFDIYLQKKKKTQKILPDWKVILYIKLEWNYLIVQRLKNYITTVNSYKNEMLLR